MPLTPAIVQELLRILGADGLVTTPEGRMVYEADRHTFYKGAPDAVALPRTTAQVQAGVRLCAREGPPSVPRGSRTGLIGRGVAPPGRAGGPGERGAARPAVHTPPRGA